MLLLLLFQSSARFKFLIYSLFCVCSPSLSLSLSCHLYPSSSLSLSACLSSSLRVCLSVCLPVCHSLSRCLCPYLSLLSFLLYLFISHTLSNIYYFQISVSNEEYISKMNLQGVSIHTACSRCGMELPERVSSPWCSRCKRSAGLCSVCRRPVKGLLHWCPVCGHGGHLSCHKLWFTDNSTCPSGCGHDCCSNMNMLG